MRNTILGVLVGALVGLVVAEVVNRVEAKNKAEKAHSIDPPKTKPMVDYQICLYQDTIWVYEGARYVGMVVDTTKCPLNNLLAEDNQ